MQTYTSQNAGVYPGWDRFGRVRKHAWVDGGYTTGTGGNPNVPPLAEIDYTYDRSSNRLTRTDARPGASWADRDFRYSYDGLDRLVQADRGAEGGSWSTAVGGQKWALDMLGNWDSIFNDTNGDGYYTSSSPDEEQERTHNFANEIEDITTLPFAYDAAGNMTEQGLPATATKKYTHDAWNRLTEVKIDAAVLGQYEYNALHWRGVKRARSPGAGSLDEMRLMYYSANWQLLEERIDRSWTSGFTEDERAQTFWGKRYIDDAVGRRRDRDANGTWDDSFFYVTDAQFSTVAMAKPNGGIVERITYDSYGKARHHFGADVTGDGATTSADGTAIQNAYGNSIGDAGYKAELDLDRDGDIDSDDYNAGISLSGGVTQSALAPGMVSFTTTGSGGSTRHGPDNPIAWDGYVFNAETGQYLVRFRWYDPVLGRWLERDPLEYRDGASMYLNVRSNPTKFIDPTGLECCGPWTALPGTASHTPQSIRGRERSEWVSVWWPNTHRYYHLEFPFQVKAPKRIVIDIEIAGRTISGDLDSGPLFRVWWTFLIWRTPEDDVGSALQRVWEILRNLPVGPDAPPGSIAYDGLTDIPCRIRTKMKQVCVRQCDGMGPIGPSSIPGVSNLPRYEFVERESNKAIWVEGTIRFRNTGEATCDVRRNITPLLENLDLCSKKAKPERSPTLPSRGPQPLQ